MNTVIRWLLRIIPAAILLQTLYFKFTAHPESVALFTTLGVEPWGRVGTGILELICGLLLLIPATTRYGALMATGLMIGAIGSHLFVIGVESMDDGGYLFILAIVVLVTAVINLYLYRDELKGDLGRMIG